MQMSSENSNNITNNSILRIFLQSVSIQITSFLLKMEDPLQLYPSNFNETPLTKDFTAVFFKLIIYITINIQ